MIPVTGVLLRRRITLSCAISDPSVQEARTPMARNQVTDVLDQCPQRQITLHNDMRVFTPWECICAYHWVRLGCTVTWSTSVARRSGVCTEKEKVHGARSRYGFEPLASGRMRSLPSNQSEPHFGNISSASRVRLQLCTRAILSIFSVSKRARHWLQQLTDRLCDRNMWFIRLHTRSRIR